MDPAPSTVHSRLGLHYFPDTRHYRESDLRAWLPEIKSLGAAWLTLLAPLDRAIPEPFLTGLMDAGIQPILHLQAPLSQAVPNQDLELLLKTYAAWGAREVVFFDRPNCRSTWPVNAWVQEELVERFLDLYLPLANLAQDCGLTPVFPPLEPGGDYWDTAFLRAALQGIQRRGQNSLLRSLVLSAYSGVNQHPLHWGAGGPERWPGARPYFTPEGQQDQHGFYIFDWYEAVAQAVLREPLPLILFGAGSRLSEATDPETARQNLIVHAQKNLSLVRLLDTDLEDRQASFSESADGTIEFSQLEPVSSHVRACNFWLLAAGQGSMHASQAWYRSDGSKLPVVPSLEQWEKTRSIAKTRPFSEHTFHSNASSNPTQVATDHPIAHYLLLPSYEWGIAEWQLEVIQPFVKKYRPTVGFSLEEAALAARVTLLGGEQSFPTQALENLERAGCQVERISGDGTSIASQLAAK